MATDTSLHIARAVDGDGASCAFLVERFTPALLAQANYRLRGALRGLVEAEDLVQEVWLVTLPRLPDLAARDGRWTPVVLRFLATTLLRKVQELVRRHLTRPAADAGLHSAPPAATTSAGVLSAVCRREQWQAVQRAIEALPDDERELLVLRGIEQIANGTIARKLGIADYEATRRYQRALESLRRALPGSVFTELASA